MNKIAVIYFLIEKEEVQRERIGNIFLPIEESNKLLTTTLAGQGTGSSKIRKISTSLIIKLTRVSCRLNESHKCILSTLPRNYATVKKEHLDYAIVQKRTPRILLIWTKFLYSLLFV